MASVAALSGRYSKLSWITAFFMTLFHIGAIWALFDFTWSGVAVLLVTYYVSLWGIGMSYHRLLTHRSYKTSKPIEYFLTICATLALEGGPLFWVATHRAASSAFRRRPRSAHAAPRRLLGAHGLDHVRQHASTTTSTRTSKYAPDLGKDPFHRWISKYHWVPLTMLGLVLLAIGGWNWVLWGVFLRTTIGLHVTWLVNSATHLWGSRRFETRDDSRNNWWVAAPQLRRGLAQQSSRAPHVGRPRPGVVRDRPHLLAHPRARSRSAWPRTSGAPRSTKPSKKRHSTDSGSGTRRLRACHRRSIPIASIDDTMSVSPRAAAAPSRSSSSSGVCLVALAVALNVGWIVMTWREVAPLLLGVIVFAAIITGLILNTTFLVREIRRNEQHDAFVNAVTHELKTPVTSIRLHLETLLSREGSVERGQAARVLRRHARGQRPAAADDRTGAEHGPGRAARRSTWSATI